MKIDEEAYSRYHIQLSELVAHIPNDDPRLGERILEVCEDARKELDSETYEVVLYAGASFLFRYAYGLKALGPINQMIGLIGPVAARQEMMMWEESYWLFQHRFQDSALRLARVARGKPEFSLAELAEEVKWRREATNRFFAGVKEGGEGLRQRVRDFWDMARRGPEYYDRELHRFTPYRSEILEVASEFGEDCYNYFFSLIRPSDEELREMYKVE